MPYSLFSANRSRAVFLPAHSSCLPAAGAL